LANAILLQSSAFVLQTMDWLTHSDDALRKIPSKDTKMTEPRQFFIIEYKQKFVCFDH